MKNMLLNKLTKKIFFLSFIQLAACHNTHEKNRTVKEWILITQDQLVLDTDSIFRQHQKENKLDSGWISFAIVNTIYADNSLGRLAKKAGDSSECIVTTVEFYHDPGKKRSIMIAAVDSTCLNKLRLTKLDTDSTINFVFGKLTKALY